MRYTTKYKKARTKVKETNPSSRIILGCNLTSGNKLRLSLDERYKEMLHRISDKYGHSIASSVDKKLKLAILTVNDYCHDSYRVCEVGDKEGERLFAEAKSCCGNEERLVTVKGYTFKIGFNYGH